MTIYRCRVRDYSRHQEAEIFFASQPDVPRLTQAIAESKLCSCPTGRMALATRYLPCLGKLEQVDLGKTLLGRASLEIILGLETVR